MPVMNLCLRYNNTLIRELEVFGFSSYVLPPIITSQMNHLYIFLAFNVVRKGLVCSKLIINKLAKRQSKSRINIRDRRSSAQ